MSHFEILGRLGRGGMGIVYLAHDLALDREVALKFLPPSAADSAEERERLLREARTASRLDHPNLCTIHEVGETEDGDLFVAMARYEGETLAERLKRGPLPLAEALEIVRQAAAGIAAAHARGIVHRDVKPANLFLTRGGLVKVLDFGLARAVGAADGARLTQAGAVIGTPLYMAPEQLRGEDADERTDLWALGVVLHEAVAARLPFGTELPAALNGILEAPAPSLFPDSGALPQDRESAIDELLAALLAKRREDRPSSAAAVAAAISSLQRDAGGGSGAALADAAAGLAPRVAATSRGADMPTTRISVSAPRAPIGVAVLDFEQRGNDSDSIWLATGLADTVAARLGRWPALRVLPPGLTRERIARDGVGDLPGIAAALGAAWLVRGGFAKLGPVLRLDVELFDVVRGKTIPAATADGPIEDVFRLVDRLLDGLRPQLGGAESLAPGIAPTSELAAFECFARARRLVNEMGPSAFAAAEPYLQRALALDPNFALAHSSLGHLLAMRFIGTTDPADLEAGRSHLERAAVLDPALADPWTWLAYCRGRAGDLPGAAEAGRRAVAAESENPLAHYFLGVALWLAAMAGTAEAAREALLAMAAACDLAPRYQPAWQLRATIQMAHGDYDSAEAALRRAAEIEESGDFELARFVGSAALLGWLHLRRGSRTEAMELFETAESLVHSDHVYAPAYLAVARLGAGEVALRERRMDEAAMAFRRAAQSLEGHPRMMGGGWVLTRARFGLARACRRLGVIGEAERLRDSAVALRETRVGYDFGAMWEGSTADMDIDQAVAEAEARHVQQAIALVGRAVESGYADTVRLASEPSLAELWGDPGAARLASVVAGRAAAWASAQRSVAGGPA